MQTLGPVIYACFIVFIFLFLALRTKAIMTFFVNKVNAFNIESKPKRLGFALLIIFGYTFFILLLLFILLQPYLKGGRL